MIIEQGLFDNDCNKVKTKEELLELLKEYRGILTYPMLNYLDSLIKLEFSVIKEYISSSDRKVLSELDIYKKVAIYNIYNRAKNLFNKQKGEFIISGNEDGVEGLEVSTKLSDRNVKLFNFDYKEIHSKSLNHTEIPYGFKTMNIGNVSLFQTFESKNFREAELDRIMKILKYLYDEQNPYPYYPNVVGGPRTTWTFDHEEKIQEYEEKLKQLDSKKELNDKDKREIEITKQIHELLLEDFGLTSENFVVENNHNLDNFDKEKSESNKIFVKKMPNLTITDYAKYI